MGRWASAQAKPVRARADVDLRGLRLAAGELAADGAFDLFHLDPGGGGDDPT